MRNIKKSLLNKVRFWKRKKKCFTKLIYFAYFYEYIRKMLNMKKKKKKKKLIV